MFIRLYRIESKLYELAADLGKQDVAIFNCRGNIGGMGIILGTYKQFLPQDGKISTL